MRDQIRRIDRCSSSSVAVDSEVLRSDTVEESSRYLLYSRSFGKVDVADFVALDEGEEEGKERNHEMEVGRKVA